jgi:hypothetical protein
MNRTDEARTDAIRARVTVLSPTFHAQYLEWFIRLGAQDIGDDDVPAILGASIAELSAMEVEHQCGRISAPGLAIGRQQVRDLAEGMLRQHRITPDTKQEIRRYILETFPLRLLEGEGRFSHDWFYYHEDRWREHFGGLAGVPGVRVLEIGCFEGRSTCWMLDELLTGDGSLIVCIDPFIAYDGQEANFDHNIRRTGQAHRVVKLRGPSQQVLHFLDPYGFDLIYVDGSHSGLDVIQDAALAWTMLKPSGAMVFDDYEDALFPGTFGFPVKPAVDAFLAMTAGRHEVIFRDWQVGIRKHEGAGQ